MSKRLSLLSLCIAASWMISGCGDDSTSRIIDGGLCDDSSPCPDGWECLEGICIEFANCNWIECGEGTICKNGACIPEDDAQKCGDKFCTDEEICVDNVCRPKSDEPRLCGDKICAESEVCIDNVCKPKPDDEKLCGKKECASDETCFNDTCRKPGDCGSIACLENETCVEDVCRMNGSCGGIRCFDDETCYEGKCMPAGDCDGIKCDEGEVCYNYECREIGDCGGVKCLSETETCYENRCIELIFCGGKYCNVEQYCENEQCVYYPNCMDGSPRCGDSCCSDEQFCGQRSTCCDNDKSCGFDCCVEGEICESATCQKDCGANARCALEDGSVVCCGDGEVCTSQMCYLPKTSCVDNYMCENDEYCEMTLKTCLPKPKTEACFMNPKGGEVQPTLVWYWGENTPEVHPDYVQVMSSPMVADMNNDTIPEVVFNTFSSGNYQGNGIVRILNGQTGELIASSDGSVMTDGGSQVALGDLDGDTIPEIVTCSAEYKLVVFNFDPKTNQISLRWKSTNTMRECGQGGPGIADFNGDGKPEVYVRYHVHDGDTGELLGSASCVNYDNSTAHAPCDYSVAADLDGDGKLELVGGNVAFKLDVEQKQLVKYYDRSADNIDGYPAVADIDLDGKPEIFVVRSNNNTVMTFNYDGSNHWPAPVAHSVGAGGPPTIANLTGDQHPELTFAGRDAYLVLDYQGNTVWQRTTHDYSSAKTGSSVFDFDGDGKAEVVYADEYFLRVYNGDDGKTVYCQCNTSGTHWEYPVVVDVDNDGHAEIVISSNNSMIRNCPTSLSEKEGWDECVDALMKEGQKAGSTVLNGTHGIRVFSSPNKDWVNTRKIYNQHAYSVTNISDNGTIPTHQRANWNIDGLNNFRLNVQPGANYLPNLEIKDVTTPYDCDVDGKSIVYFTVKNSGWATAPAGITVKIYSSMTEDGEYTLVGSLKTPTVIRASQEIGMQMSMPEGQKIKNGMFFLITFGDDAPTQCRDDNHSVTHQAVCRILVN